MQIKFQLTKNTYYQSKMKKILDFQIIIDKAGITVINIPANNFPTSWIGNHVNPFFS